MTAEIGSVAAGTVRFISGAPGSGLLGGERSGRWLGHASRSANHCHRTCKTNHPQHGSRSYRNSQPHKTPSGAFSLWISTYNPPLRRLVNCWGVNSNDPVMVPLAALEIVRSPIAGPLTPAATELCRLADVAAESNPANEPVIASLVPVSTDDAEPEPARLARVLASAGRAERRALKVSLLCASSESENTPNPSAITASAIRRLKAIAGFHFTSKQDRRGLQLSLAGNSNSCDPIFIVYDD